MKYCKLCGGEISERARYCPSCGIQITDVGAKGVVERIQESDKASLFEIPENERAKIIGKFDKDEKILFQRWIKVDLTEKYLDRMFFVAILILAFLIILILISFIFRSKNTEMDRIVIFVFLVILAAVTYPLFGGLTHYIDVKRVTRLTNHELKHYVEGSILTNKRWIEKSYEIFNLKLFDYPPNTITKERDIILIKKSFVYLRYSEIKPYNFIEIEIFLNLPGETEHPIKIRTFIMFVDKFKTFLEEIEKNLDYSLGKTAESAGVIQFKSKNEEGDQ